MNLKTLLRSFLHCAKQFRCFLRIDLWPHLRNMLQQEGLQRDFRSEACPRCGKPLDMADQRSTTTAVQDCVQNSIRWYCVDRLRESLHWCCMYAPAKERQQNRCHYYYYYVAALWQCLTTFFTSYKGCPQSRFKTSRPSISAPSNSPTSHTFFNSLLDWNHWNETHGGRKSFFQIIFKSHIFSSTFDGDSDLMVPFHSMGKNQV